MRLWRTSLPGLLLFGTWQSVGTHGQMGILLPVPLPFYNMRPLASYHFLHDQYPALNLDFFSSHLCLARKDLRRAGSDFRIRILGSPNLTRRTLSPSLASTANFLDFPGVRLGLLYPENRSLR